MHSEPRLPEPHPTAVLPDWTVPSRLPRSVQAVLLRWTDMLQEHRRRRACSHPPEALRREACSRRSRTSDRSFHPIPGRTAAERSHSCHRILPSQLQHPRFRQQWCQSWLPHRQQSRLQRRKSCSDESFPSELPVPGQKRNLRLHW